MLEQPISNYQKIRTLEKELEGLRDSLTTVKTNTSSIYKKNSAKIPEKEKELKDLKDLENIRLGLEDEKRQKRQIPIVNLVTEVTEYIELNAEVINENSDRTELEKQILAFRRLREKINEEIRRCEDRGKDEDDSSFKKYRALKEQLYEIISNLDSIITEKSEAGRVSQDNQTGRKRHQDGKTGSL